MEMSRTQLEQFARELQAQGSEDPDVLAKLCSVYWRLKRQEEAVATFELLLRHEPPAPDPAFDPTYLKALRVTGSPPVPLRRRPRLMHLMEILNDTAHVRGDVVECGCFLGLSSYMLCSYLKRQNPQFDGTGYHVFDSFQGLSEPTADDEISDDFENAEKLRMMSQRGAFYAPLEVVKSNLRAFPKISFHPGWIPLSFKGLPEACYRFVHVDVDLYDPTLDAFTYFYPRLSPGGAIVSDDYSWPGARTAIDEFCAEHQVTLHANSVGQAIVRKRAE